VPPRHGFIREKDDIKFLILYVMTFLQEGVTFADLADMVMCDDAFGYFEFAECAGELVESLHIRKEFGESEELYYITEKGTKTAEAFEKRLPSVVREAAQRSAVRVVRRNRRNATILCRDKQRSDGTDAVELAVMDGDVPVFALELMVLTEKQSELFKENFRNHAEKIYDGILDVLLANYEQEPSFIQKDPQKNS